MARLASQAKAGYYPTPDRVCDLLREKLHLEENARLLDPCCGKGRTLARLAETDSTAITHGIELDHMRTQRARTRLDHVLWGDALIEMKISPQSFGLLLLNPPYDNAPVREEEGKSQRMEVQFLRRYQRVLEQDGLLIFIIPWYVLRHCAQPLGRYFELEVLGFPPQEYENFNQCIVLGRKRPLRRKELVERTVNHLNRLAEMTAQEFLANVQPLEEIIPDSIGVSAPRKAHYIFTARHIDPLEAIPRIQKAAVLANLLEEMAPRTNREIRPLLPLENGHLALMLAGGYMNGAITKEGRELIIKGLVQKSEQVIDVRGTGEGTITTKDKYVPTVKVIDMKNRELLTVQ